VRSCYFKKPSCDVGKHSFRWQQFLSTDRITLGHFQLLARRELYNKCAAVYTASVIMATILFTGVDSAPAGNSGADHSPTQAKQLYMPALQEMRGAETYLTRKGWYSTREHGGSPRSPGGADNLDCTLDCTFDCCHQKRTGLSQRLPRDQRASLQRRSASEHYLVPSYAKRASPISHEVPQYGDETFCLFNMD
jgi:hypothetical protein